MLTKWPVLAKTFLFLILVSSEALSQENLPSLIKRIQPSVAAVAIYDSSGDLIRQGSGFFVSDLGDLVTNNHVIEGASRIEVRTSDGKSYSVKKIVAIHKETDLVQLSVSIPKSAIKPIIVSRQLPEVGQRVIVIGSPLGLDQTVSDGIVSAIRDVPRYGKIIQITAPISSGSSGSPVVNMKGEVIGVATLQMIKGQNLNFAIPGDRVLALGTEHKLEDELKELRGERKKLETERKRLEEARWKAEDGRRRAENKNQRAEANRRKSETTSRYRIEADQGNAEAQTVLGTMYRKGKGVTKDYAKALMWFRKAANQGYGEAQNELGVMYEEGQGVTKDYAAALKWYRKAAEQGYGKAQYNLGLMYERGRGVTQDNAEAARWYRAALKWYRKAAEQGNAIAQYKLGIMYERGRGVTQDNAEAARWYHKAADQGEAWGQFALALMNLTAQDYGEAAKWYRKVVDQDGEMGEMGAVAQWSLGFLYFKGSGVLQDYKEAVRLYRKAANQGYAFAQNELGFMYDSGQGVSQDYVQAHMWYNLAAAQGEKDTGKARDLLAKKMTPSQIAEAQKLAREWKPKGK